MAIKKTSRVRKAVTGGGNFCSLREEAIRSFDTQLDPHRVSLIRDISNKWANGTVLHYHFLEEPRMAGTASERKIVVNAFKIWKKIGIGLSFKEVGSPSEAEIRIGFLPRDGAWSYIGRYVLNIGTNERTMNFGWDLNGQDGLDTAIHEIGHTLGFPHEHQNPNAGLVWDEEAVYAELGGRPNNWNRDKTFHNIIRKLDPTAVEGSDWDSKSIMHYPFDAKLIKAPEPYASKGVQNPKGLSATDKKRAIKFYPSINDGQNETLNVLQSIRLELKPGEQKNFTITPDATKKYEFSTFGESDVVMVLFENRNGTFKYVTADDDSGEDTNAKLKIRLDAGKKYILRIRMYYRKDHGNTAVMMW